MAEPRADIAVIGLAVMGQNLILNMNDHGFVVCAFNRTVSKVDHFLANEAKGTKVIGAHSLEEMVQQLKRPRKVMLMVMAGAPVDSFIEQLVPLLQQGDIIIDGGNSHFPDTVRRCKQLEAKGILFVGCGVSGGEEGARYGPSLMPGGSPGAWPHIKPIFQAIAAKAEGAPCCEWIGENGSGHYVKMVHNGIEYGDMQLISEAYHLMKDGLGLSCDEMAATFAEWNKGDLDSFLIEITAAILAYKDPSDGHPLVEKIRDSAGQKGTGKWTAISSLDMGIPVTLIGEAVFARCLSSLKNERLAASQLLHGPTARFTGDKNQFIEQIRRALYASKIISYTQGYMLFREAAKEYKWNLNYGGIALVWREGCIIRSRLLGKIESAFMTNPSLSNLLVDPYFQQSIDQCQDAWRQTVSTAVLIGIPTPAFSTALAFYDGYRSARLPANLIQAQRDFFGAHMYELESRPGTFVHTDWTGTGGSTASTQYVV